MNVSMILMVVVTTAQTSIVMMENTFVPVLMDTIYKQTIGLV